jgi:hypothetical protein
MDRQRLIRGLRIAVSLACAIVCLLILVLWARSYSREDVIGCVDSRNRTVHFVSRTGGISLNTANHDPTNPGAWRKYVAWEPGIVGFGGFTTARSTSVKVPHWFPVLLFATLATLPLIRWRWKYSLRTLLIATTLIAVLLGLVVYLARIS